MTHCPSTSEIRPQIPTCPESADNLHCPCRINGVCCWCGNREQKQLSLDTRAGAVRLTPLGYLVAASLAVVIAAIATAWLWIPRLIEVIR